MSVSSRAGVTLRTAICKNCGAEIAFIQRTDDNTRFYAVELKTEYFAEDARGVRVVTAAGEQLRAIKLFNGELPARRIHICKSNRRQP